jgi:hypothetical protein
LQPGQAINQVAANLVPADMSNQIIGVINQVVSFTKECLGVTDVQLGNVTGENTSAIMVMQSNAEVPLENIRAGMYEWSEEIVKILLDMMGTYYGMRPIARSRSMETVATDLSSGMPVMNQYTGMLKTQSENRRVLEFYDFSRLKKIFLNVRVDVGSATAYSEIAMMQTLDNLRSAQLIDIIDYLERVPDKLIPRKQELVDKLKLEKLRQDGVTAGLALPDSQAQREMAGIQKQINAAPKDGGKTVGGSLDQDKAVSELPSNVQAQFEALPTRAKNALAKSISMKMNGG